MEGRTFGAIWCVWHQVSQRLAALLLPCLREAALTKRKAKDWSECVSGRKGGKLACMVGLCVV